MSYEGMEHSNTCGKCKATYRLGTPHICQVSDVEVSRKKLEGYLGEFTLEHD